MSEVPLYSEIVGGLCAGGLGGVAGLAPRFISQKVVMK